MVGVCERDEVVLEEEEEEVEEEEGDDVVEEAVETVSAAIVPKMLFWQSVSPCEPATQVYISEQQVPSPQSTEKRGGHEDTSWRRFRRW